MPLFSMQQFVQHKTMGKQKSLYIGKDVHGISYIYTKSNQVS